MVTPTPLSLLILAILLLVFFTPSLCSKNAIYSDLGGGSLNTGEKLVYGDYSLVMQSDCDLVVYNKNSRIWATGTQGMGTACYLNLFPTGELVIYGFDGGIFRAFWGSGVVSTPGRYALVLKFDGTIHVYGPTLWSKPNPIVNFKRTDRSNLLTTLSSRIATSTVDSTFWTDDVAPIGTVIANEYYRLELHHNCNLTLSDDETNETLWHTNTNDEYNLYDCFVTLEKNGLFVIKYIGGAPLWNSESSGPDKSDYVLALRPDGNVAVYGPSIWFAGAMNETGSHAALAEKIAMVTE